jgi:hypothetical protein
MKIINKEVLSDGTIFLTMDEPIRVTGTHSVFKDENQGEWGTVPDAYKLKSIYGCKLENPQQLNEMGIRYWGETSADCHKRRQITLDI